MELISFITGTGAENFVDQASNDGRRMMTALRNHYNGPGEVTKRYKKAEERLKGLHYRNESVFPWSTFVSELTKCFTAYEKAGRPIDPRTKMDHLMTKCLPNELAPVKEVARTQHPNDIHAAANQQPPVHIIRRGLCPGHLDRLLGLGVVLCQTQFRLQWHGWEQ